MWGLIDCDNFFCSCERVFRPDLNGVPVVVLSNNDGCVVARTREVKAMGVPEGMPYYQLLEKYPRSGIVAFSSNYELYGDMSARIMAILQQETPEVIQYSIDEAFVNLSGIDLSLLKGWGEALCRKVRRWTGMPISLGIGPTKTLAKVAVRFAKDYPGYHKCCVIASDEQREKALKLFPVGKVWGIGRRLAAKLNYHGVATAYDLTQRQRGWVRAQMHVTGERTWQELCGIPAIDLGDLNSTTRKSIMTSRSMPGMIDNLEDLATHVANHAARSARKLRAQHSVCELVTVFVQSNRFRDDLPQYENSASLSFATATDSTIEIVGAAKRLLASIFRPGILYKRAGVMVSGIHSAEFVQPDLFDYDPERAGRHSSISAAIDEINRRLGMDTVILA
ncbi:MAG: Y-family DNA polymerase, partial [Muribaculaceae bacterium]|nr:Y-family DNA polymerase [Muribaculaceae bacterium]